MAAEKVLVCTAALLPNFCAPASHSCQRIKLLPGMRLPHAYNPVLSPLSQHRLGRHFPSPRIIPTKTLAPNLAFSLSCTCGLRVFSSQPLEFQIYHPPVSPGLHHTGDGSCFATTRQIMTNPATQHHCGLSTLCAESLSSLWSAILLSLIS